MATPFASVTYYCADQNPHRDRSRGITNLTAGLLQRLHATGLLQMEIIASRSSHPIFEGVARQRLAFRTDHFLGHLAGDHLHPFLVAGAQRPGKHRLWHYPKGFLPWGAQVRAPRVGTVCDVILQFYADRYPALLVGAGLWLLAGDAQAFDPEVRPDPDDLRVFAPGDPGV